MAKNKTLYVCSDCGYESAKWMGRCPSCGAWNKMEEQEPAASVSSAASGPQRKSTVTVPSAPARTLDQIEEGEQERSRCGIAEFDRVLGGGIVPGSLILIGGDPGIGKSTLLLQVSALLAGQGARVLYVSGEESARQIKMRAKRLGVGGSGMYVLSETNMDEIEAQRSVLTPDYMIVDSIQTVYVPGKNAAPGSVSQVREATSILMRAAKQAGTTIFLVGHVTKEGALAGPRVLEHMVDAVLYFEGERQFAHRIIRGVKNRFGSTNEIGVFEMTESGLEEVPNPSEMLLEGRPAGVSGNCAVAIMEGSRPIIAEIQSLVTQTVYPAPKRSANGFDFNRMCLLLAVLEKRLGLRFSTQDIYLNIVGGLRIDEPAADLPAAMAMISGILDKPLPDDLIAAGEIGLAGECRAIVDAEQRVREAERLGFKRILLPARSAERLRRGGSGIEILGVRSIRETLTVFGK